MRLTLNAADRAWLDLTQKQRLEMVDWLRGCGIDPDRTHAVRLTAEGEAAAYVCPAPHTPSCLDTSGDHWVLFRPDMPPPDAWPYFEED